MKRKTLPCKIVLLAGYCLFAAGAAAGASAAGAKNPAIVGVSGAVAAQAIEVLPNGVYHAAPTVAVQYTLRRAQAVSINVWRARPFGLHARWYAHPGNLVGSFKVPAGKAGPQSSSFAVADLKAPQAVVPLARDNAYGQKKDPPLPDNFIVEVLGENGAVAHASLQILPAGARVASSRGIPSVASGVVRDSHGNYLISNPRDWRAQRYTPQWLLEETYPKASLGQSSDPVETFDIAIDSKDTVYACTVNGLYKFGPDGNPAPWADSSDYLKCPYPSEVKNNLGVRLAQEGGKHHYVWGPGGGGAGAKDYSPEDTANPGFAARFGGAALDGHDNIYLIADQGKFGGVRLQVFDTTGKFVRYVPLPAGQEPHSVRFGTDGTLWLTAGYNLLALDPSDGTIKKTVTPAGRGLHIGPDGTIYTYDGSRLWRYDLHGAPLPFTATSPFVRDKGNTLDLGAPGANLPADAAGLTNSFNAVAGHADGSFDILAGLGDRYKDNSVLHFTNDGAFAPDSIALQLHPDEAANVFVGDQAATVSADITNLRATPAALTLTTTVRELNGAVISSDATRVTVPAAETLAAHLPLSTKRMGYYEIDVAASEADQPIGSWRLYGGRVWPRGDTYAPYSPFGSVRMEAAPEVIRRAGGALNRNHFPLYWDDTEPQPGQWTPYPADTLNYFKTRAMVQMGILAYGEPWLKGGFPACRIYDYDDFFDYLAHTISRHKGTAAIWQFWNEPNYFWHVPGPYQFETYAEVQAAAYSICKAYDPETPMIGDGFAGSAAMMADLAREGSAGYADGVPIHYPGSTIVNWDNMPLNGPVESKAAMVRDLAKIRDQYFPGRPLYNTEEGLWGKGDRTAQDGAYLLPRIYISQIAAGLDHLTWFECFSSTDPTYLLRDPDNPWPAYFAYATASRFLENAQYVGAASSSLAQVHYFALAGRPLIAAWSVQGERDVTLTVGVPKVTVYDWQGNAATVAAPGGRLTLHLNESVQYLTGAGEMANAAIRERDAKELDLPKVGEALAMVSPATSFGPRELFHAARLNEVEWLMEPFASLPRMVHGRTSVAQAVNALAAAQMRLQTTEADGSYLRETHTILGIARRNAYFMNYADVHGNTTYAQLMAPYVAALAHQVDLSAKSEAKWYPGIMLRTELDTSAIRKNTPADQPLDEKFDPQVNKKRGDTVELEITVYNWTAAAITGKVAPALPAGWQAADASFDYNVEPMKFARFTTTVTVPADAAAATYSLGAMTMIKGAAQREYHSVRVVVER